MILMQSILLFQTHLLQLFNYKSRNYKPATIFPNFSFPSFPKTPQISLFVEPPFLNSFQFLPIEKKKEEETKQSLFPISLKSLSQIFPSPFIQTIQKKKNKSTNQSPSKEIPQTIQSASQFPPFHYVIIIPETTTPYFPPRSIRTGLLSLSISIAPETDDERRANIEA